MATLKQWVIAATAAEIRQLAAAAGTSVAYVSQLASGHRTASAETAGRIADVSAEMHERSGGRLPVLVRADICPACAACPHAKACKA